MVFEITLDYVAEDCILRLKINKLFQDRPRLLCSCDLAFCSPANSRWHCCSSKSSTDLICSSKRLPVKCCSQKQRGKGCREDKQNRIKKKWRLPCVRECEHHTVCFSQGRKTHMIVKALRKRFASYTFSTPIESIFRGYYAFFEALYPENSQETRSNAFRIREAKVMFSETFLGAGCQNRTVRAANG